MSILLVGLNHKTAPVEVRERLAFSDEECATGLRSLVDGEAVREGLIMSTCNRVEVLTETGASTVSDVMARVVRFLSEARSLPVELFDKHFYRHEDDKAVRHIFRVASSLDSMVVGEPQVLGQVRRAYALAVEAGTTGRVLNRLIHHTLRVAKRVRSETGIAASAVSISYMAVELGRKIFGALDGRTILLVGAGEMAELSARHLINSGAARVLIANRTMETAERLADEFQGQAVELSDLTKHLAESDIVICSTNAPDYLITHDTARKALEMRRNRPSFYIDISVPRNIDPRVGEINNLFVFDIDDLEAVIASNIREREREAERAELIVESEVMQFQQSLRTLDIGPTLGALRQKMQTIARGELEKQRSRLGQLTPEQEEAIEALLISTVNKISHPVINRLRSAYGTGEDDEVQAVRDMFGLED
ncbi:MAG TPA: glutamyl-tRNA reductase [Pyrinomonadaceae bacterium]|nr:glutamyl-tRNA reductase [Pyrinomonadaceae bacterium]